MSRKFFDRVQSGSDNSDMKMVYEKHQPQLSHVLKGTASKTESHKKRKYEASENSTEEEPKHVRKSLSGNSRLMEKDSKKKHLGNVLRKSFRDRDTPVGERRRSETPSLKTGNGKICRI